MKVVKDGKVVEEQVPLRNAMNEVLRDAYVEDDERCVKKWNRVLEKEGMDFRLRLPSRRFHRHIGIYAGHWFDPDGHLLSEVEWEKRRNEWLPNAKDRSYVQGLMAPVLEPGRIANWVAPPRVGINKHPFAWEYVRL
jgi:benzoyl-CoA 2,3-dioxygenase component B